MNNITLIIIIVFICYIITKPNCKKEPFSDNISETNREALYNISSLYNGETLTVDNATVTGTLTTETLTAGTLNLLPRGIITMWTGTTAPDGWALCDGNNGTPDLRNRFVLGAGTKSIGTTGGTETHTLAINELPSHNHNQYTNRQGENNGEWAAGAPARLMVGDRGNGQWISNFSHNTGGGQPHNNMPPYYVTAFIMKL